jgi:hypothetical protein
MDPIMTQERLSPPDEINLLVTAGKESAMSRGSPHRRALNHQFHRKPALLSDPSASHFNFADEI